MGVVNTWLGDHALVTHQLSLREPHQSSPHGTIIHQPFVVSFTEALYGINQSTPHSICLLYTSDAADEMD